MRIQRVYRIFSLGLLCGGATLGIAYAQDTLGAAPGGTPTEPPSTGMQRELRLTPQEQLTGGKEIVVRVDGVSKNVRRQLEMARQQRDVVKSLCLSDKLTELDVTRKSAEDRYEALRQANARQDTEMQNHEYTILVVLRERADQLAAEANQCIGVEAGFVGDTKITVDVDPNLPTEDPSQYPENPIIAIPPSCASCVG